MAVSAGSIPVAALAAAPGVLVLLSAATGYRRRASADRALVSKATDYAESGRRLAIYERETGLLAHWYLSLRGKEECERAARYQRPLTLLLVEPAPESDPVMMHGHLAQWLRSHLRAVDIIGYLGNQRHVVLMPESDMAGARLVASRFRAGLGRVDIGLAELPADGTTYDQLYAAASQRLGKPIEQAA
jgi:GGDEF domain-containing protein